LRIEKSEDGGFIKPQDLELEFENVFEQYLEDINQRNLAINSKIHKKL